MHGVLELRAQRPQDSRVAMRQIHNVGRVARRRTAALASECLDCAQLIPSVTDLCFGWAGFEQGKRRKSLNSKVPIRSKVLTNQGSGVRISPGAPASSVS